MLFVCEFVGRHVEELSVVDVRLYQHVVQLFAFYEVVEQLLVSQAFYEIYCGIVDVSQIVNKLFLFLLIKSEYPVVC